MERNKTILVVIGLMISLQGCSTVKEGSKGIAQGFKQDIHNTWTFFQNVDGPIQKADNWIQKNLW